MTVTYDVQISNAYGVKLTPQRGNGYIGDANQYSAMSWSRVVNDAGVLVLTYPGELLPQLMRPDNIITVYRNVDGMPQLVTETAWLLRKTRRIQDGDGRLFTELTAYSGNYLLSSRGIAYQTASTQSTKTGAADDLIKAYVRENLGSSATDTARRLANISVQANTGQGESLSAVMGWRDNLLVVAQELAQASIDAGKYVAFDTVYQGGGLWDFRTYAGQRSIDRRTPGSSFGFLLGSQYGNVSDAEYSIDWSANVTAAYALGTGINANRVFATALNGARIAESPYGRREGFVDGGNASTVALLTPIARAAIRAGRPRVTFRMRIVETAASRFGIDWNWGDYVTASALGITVDARIDAVTVQVQDGRENIDAYVGTE